LEERRNRQDLIEVYKMYKCFTRLDTGELYVKDLNVRGKRGHSLKLEKLAGFKKVYLLTQSRRALE